jgi:dolichol kinase
MRVKSRATEIVLSYVASICLLLTVFHRPLGLADYWDWVFMAVCLVALIGLFLAHKRQKAALAGTASGEPPKPNRKLLWFSLVLIIVTSLSSFFWLPYTGVAVSLSQLIMISITTCIFSVMTYLIAWRRSHRSNKSLEPTAGRRTEKLKDEL